MMPVELILSDDAAADLLGDTGETLSARLPDGARLDIILSANAKGTQHASIPHPSLTAQDASAPHPALPAQHAAILHPALSAQHAVVPHPAMPARHARAVIPHPALTARLAELGFVIEHASDDRLSARKSSVSIRGYRDGDEHAIRELFRRSFHVELSEAMWRWRYVDNPLGARRISLAFGADGALLGHYGGYPMAFQHAGQTLRAHQNGDVMTDRRARRLGHGDVSIVRRLAQHFWAAYGEGRVDFHYGFNTATARALQMRVVPGVRVLEDVGMWVHPDIFASLSDSDSSSSDSNSLDSNSSDSISIVNDGLHAERVPRFDAEWDAFAHAVVSASGSASDYGLCSRRNAASLNWRYADRPGSDDVLIVVRKHGRIVGGAVFQRHQDETRWGDALFDRHVTRAPAVALAYLRMIDAAPRVRAWFPARPEWWARALRSLGFRQEPEPNGLSLLYVPFTAEAERLMPRLYYSWGDSDLF